MILSVSRRTDIPKYFSDWFFQRIKEQYVYVRNPFNPHQISKIDISPEIVDCIVFWTKNPENMMKRMDELAGYTYYFQFTLTGYGTDIEADTAHKREQIIPVFQKLVEKIGRERVIWRYDPILFTERYTEEYHLKAFRQIAEALKGYTEKCVISFLDMYPKIKKNMEDIGRRNPSYAEAIALADAFRQIAEENSICLYSCAEKINLEPCRIYPNCCIDKTLIERLTGYKIKAQKDKGQREVCGCMESIDIGAYDTCLNGCKYCYANSSLGTVRVNVKQYDPLSPLLCSRVTEKDKITERKVKSLKEEQISLFI
ncbi:DUF1848 domain-containing protein [Mediterraneibacter sp. NSJ-55]|uniref:DUF1848 domain-containing protein n=1 Tax=Mediterraneibacter hominis TaxID=2763054 RepID=A0A923LI00_9FIRM|nr:DUF1848 domain-containing protein [Mediterraneibacter hominis]MBC5689021.1 DUF1848 domain-containing protein [Mediterraneibacter hominis]